MTYFLSRLIAAAFIAVSLIVSPAAAPGAFAQAPAQKTAIFAGGCFWCMQAAFEELSGVTKVVAGYTGGHVPNPTYEQVSSGDTGHYEAIQVTYDPAKLDYTKLLNWFWDNVDPNDPNGQFCDKGSQYAAGIFYADDEQKKLAEASLAQVEQKMKTKIAAFIQPAAPFYPAEDYHQDYYKKNTLHYTLYKTACGREQTLDTLRKK